MSKSEVTSPPRYSRRRPKATTLALLICTLWILAFTRGYRTTNDGSSIALARAVSEEGRFTIDDYWQYTLDVDGARRGSHFYSDRPPGSALVASVVIGLTAPLGRGLGCPRAYWAERVATLVAVVFGVLALAATAALVRLFDARDLDAAVAVLALGLGTLHLVYSTRLFPHVPAGAVLVGAAWLLWGAGMGRRPPGDAIVGALLGGAVGMFFAYDHPGLARSGLGVLQPVGLGSPRSAAVLCACGHGPGLGRGPHRAGYL